MINPIQKLFNSLSNLLSQRSTDQSDSSVSANQVNRSSEVENSNTLESSYVLSVLCKMALDPQYERDNPYHRFHGLTRAVYHHDEGGFHANYRTHAKIGDEVLIRLPEEDFRNFPEDKDKLHAYLHAVMLYVKKNWDGEAFFKFSEDFHGKTINFDVERSLLIRAYSEVYEVNISQREGAVCLVGSIARGTDEEIWEPISQARLQELPTMRAKIREMHKDAPPYRPGEEERLAKWHANKLFMGRIYDI